MKLSHTLSIAAVVCALAAGPPSAGSGDGSRSHASAPARLVIKRAANFGNEAHFNIYIDGVRVTNLGWGESYDGLVPAGDHLITLKQMPHLNDAYPFSQHRVRLAPGRTTVFTAIWRNGGTFIALEQP